MSRFFTWVVCKPGTKSGAKPPDDASRQELGQLLRNKFGGRPVWTSKLKSHYRRLMHQRRVEGLMRWRRCALALYQGGLPVQSGTIPCERQWSYFISLFSPKQRMLGEPVFHLLSNMAFLRHIRTHYNSGIVPAWARKDHVLAQKVAELDSLLEMAAAGDTK